MSEPSSSPPTPTTPSRNPADVSSSFSPVKRLAAEHQMKVLCIAIAIVVPIICLIFMGKALRDSRSPQTTFFVDGSGVVHIGPLEGLNPESRLFRELIMQMVQTHFTRNPEGLSYPEFADRLYSQDAMDALKAEVVYDSSLFKLRNYFQQVEIVGIDPLDWKGEFPRYRARGYVVRSGVVDGMAQRNGPFYFRLSYELEPNPKVGERGQYPHRVKRYRLTWTDEAYEKVLGFPEMEAHR